MKKFLCECGKLATWEYMPSSKQYPYFCEDCVPRGCSCNREYTPTSVEGAEYDRGENPPTDHNQWRWIEKDVSWEYTDEKGRPYPCCEFWYRDDGYTPYDGKPSESSPEGGENELAYMDRNNVKYYLTES